jgi:hypothetical protein
MYLCAMRLAILFFITITIGTSGCAPSIPTDTKGFDWHLYLDTKQAMLKDVTTNGRKVKSFVETIHHANGKVDSNYLIGTQIDWDSYLQPVLGCNLYDSTLQGVYKMSQFIDTITKTVDIHYDPMYEQLPVRKMIVKLNSDNSDLQSMYAETDIKKTFSHYKQTILYRPGQLLQIVKTDFPLFGKMQRNAKQLIAIQSTEPEITITNGLGEK